MSGLMGAFIGSLHAFHFLRPAWLLALPLLWAFGAWLARRQGRVGDWNQVIDAGLLEGLRLATDDTAGSTQQRPWPWLLSAWTLAVLALAGPSWEQEQSPAYRAPAAWVVVLDLSPSMNVADLTPNRVTRARYVIEDLLAAVRDARVGLVAFSDEAYTVAPLTQDTATVHALLAPLAPELMPSSGDALTPALKRAQEMLQSATPGGERRIVVLSDGFNDPAAALQQASQLRAQGVEVDVIGMGTLAGAPAVGTDGQFLQSVQGGARIMSLDPGLLRQLADAGGGHYFGVDQTAELARTLVAAQRQAHGKVTAATASGDKSDDVRVASWLDSGFWLLPLVVLFAAGLARRGWV